ncbi:methyl-accepting chemotaxis protein [Nitrincola iocasae]|uniref:Methyl-accepting chemotaxis protein n=1 Tax=Nitrincola iocasae TaxID=2614693 RepID=A0A5J6LDH7_9GAMM|nr:methyl-accepting chemotaxis protein [Nitrincola iocasae]QEW06655.1 methyl-accepting chemotaxis protein [Nitrincola iocasae]
MNSFSLVRKISLGFFVLLLLLVVIAGSSLFSMLAINAEIGNLNGEAVPLSRAAGETESSLLRADQTLNLALRSQNTEKVNQQSEQFKGNFSNVLAALDSIPAPVLAKEPEIAEKVLEAKAAAAAYAEFANTLMGLQVDKLENDQRVFNGINRVGKLDRQLSKYLDKYLNSSLSRRNPDLKLVLETLSRSTRSVLNGMTNYLADHDLEALNLAVEGQELIIRENYDALVGFNEDLGKLFSLMIPQLLHDLESEQGLLQSYRAQVEINSAIDARWNDAVNEVDHALEDLSVLSATSDRLLLRSQSVSDETLERSLLWLWVAAGVAVLLTLVIAVLIARSIKSSLHAFRSQLVKMTDGDMTVSFDAARKDEFGELGGYLNELSATLHKTLKEIAQISELLEEKSQNNADYSASTTSGVDKQQALLETTASAMTEMESAVQEIANRSQHTLEVAERSKCLMDNVKLRINTSSESIRSQAVQINDASEKTAELNEYGTKIDSIVDTIHNIADQTNLLALNAAIEAARAGDNGRGFSVVADEVRTLAARTQQSTSEIQSMVELMQKLISAVVNVMEKSQSQSQVSLEAAASAESGLVEMNTAISDIVEMNVQIASATEEQSYTAREISESIVSINEAAESNASDARSSTQIADELKGMAERQRSLIAHFKL